MAEVPRISPDEARRHATAGTALLVCAYEDEAKCGSMRLEGAVSLRELEARQDSLPREQELILYWA